MNEIKKMLYQLQRFQILALFTNSQAQRKVSQGYAFAWSEGVYPIFGDGADWHQAYADCFDLSKQQVEELFDFLTDRWDQKKPISFYDLEDHYGVRRSAASSQVWDRGNLWKVCRYIYLSNNFDDEFWSALVENGKCPTEAHSVVSSFDVSDVYFE